MDLTEKIKILEYKKQIILQGPPGTGKTRLAKELSKQIVEPKKTAKPIEEIDDFFNSFDSSTPEVVEKRSLRKKLLADFESRFPKDKLKDLSLSSYCIGRGTNDSFCWWIERGLRPLGAYSPGRAWSYLIYWDKSADDYSKHGVLLKNVKTDDEAMVKVASVISDVVMSKDPYKGSAYFGESYLLKILNSYYPDEFFPINGKTFLSNALKLFGVDPAGMDKVQMNRRLVQLFDDKKKSFFTDVSPFDLMSFLADNYDMNGNIQVDSDQVLVKGEYKLIQFHPAYTYEDFVRGIVAKTNSDNKVYYAVENKTLAEFAQKAIDNPSANFVLIIDEINRANLPAVLGELIYALEYRFDKNNPVETSVESMYGIPSNDNDITDEEDNGVDKLVNKVLKLPPNLFIIGTMNTADRSVGHIDYAIRRRFAFVDVLPKEIPELTDNGKKLFQKVALLFCEKFEEGNSDLKNSKYLAQDFKPTDVILGHSYFLIKEEDRKALGKTDDEILEMKLTYEILPLLREYVKDGILSKEAELQFKPTIAEWLKL